MLQLTCVTLWSYTLTEVQKQVMGGGGAETETPLTLLDCTYKMILKLVKSYIMWL